MTRRTLIPKATLLLSGILLLTGILFLTGLGGCDMSCRNMIFQRKLSPDGRHSAVLFQRDCGATTDFSTHISLVAPDATPAQSGNVFVSDNGHTTARAGPWNGPWAEMEWLAADHLVVRHAFGARVIVRKEKARGVKITFQPTD